MQDQLQTISTMKYISALMDRKRQTGRPFYIVL